MKVSIWVARLAAILAITFIAFTDFSRADNALRQPNSVVRTAYDYDYPDTAAQDLSTVSDTKAEAEAAKAGPAATETVVTTPVCPDQPWTLPQPCFFQRHNIRMGGWLEQGITFNNLSPADKFNGPNALNDRDCEYQLNQAWLYFDRTVNTEGCGWDWGGHLDLSYGTDWRFGQCYGLENRINSMNSFYGLIVPQFYADVAVNNLTVRMGHFASDTSLEKVPAVANFFYSHAYLLSGYFDPLLVTGIQADYKLGDNWDLVGGMNRGWLEFEYPNATWNFLGGIKWHSDNKRHNVSLLLDSGDMPGFTGVHQRNSFFGVYTFALTKRLQYGSQYNIGQETNGSVVTPGQNANWYGTEQMLTFQFNKKWAAGIRYEWVRDEQGSRVAGIGNVMLTDRGWNGLPGCAGSYSDLTLGLNYRPNLNWVVRPEVRWDCYNGDPNANGELPYGNHQRSSQCTFACDLICTF